MLDGKEGSGRLDVNPSTGLLDYKASERLEKHGANTIREKLPRPMWCMLLDQFMDFMTLWRKRKS